MTSQSSRRDGAADTTTAEMELEHTPTQDIDLQTVSIEHTQPHIRNNHENSNIKQEPEFHRNGDAVEFSEHVKYGDNVANMIDIKTEVNDDTDYHYGNLNSTHGPTHSGDQFPDTNTIKPEPEDETHTTSDFVIELDTCKDEYYEQYGYPTNSFYSVNVQNTEQHCGCNLSAIDLEQCRVGLTDIRHTYPDIITLRSVHIHSAGLTSVIDGPSEASVTDQMGHARSIKINKTHMCQVCGAAFPSNSKLNRHTLTHTGVKPYTCPVCGVGFTQKHHLKTHTRIHTGEKPHNCSLCEVSFKQKVHLSSHMRTHTGEKPNKCYVCEVSFSEKGHLTSHMRTHTGEKPYECYVCGVRFTESGTLARHMRKHTGEKPYKCSVCELSFAQKCNLTQHMRTHTGEKPYKCSVCGVGFARKIDVNRHVRIHNR